MKSEQKQEIRLRDMIYKILTAWRLLAVLTVCFALVLSLGKFAIDLTRYLCSDKDSQSTVISRDDLEGELSALQLSNVKEAETLRSLVKEKEKYVKESLYFAIDPYNQHTVTLLYFVDTDASVVYSNGILVDKGTELAKSYTSYLENNLFKDSEDEKAVYYRELVIAECVEESGYQFTVTVISSTKEQAEALVKDEVKSLMEKAEVHLDKTLADHDLVLIDEGYSLQVNHELVEEKETFMQNLNTLRKNLSTLENGFSRAQSELYQFGVVTMVEDETPAPVAKPSFRVKYLILGALLGFFFGVVWVALMYMTGSRLRNAEELTETYGLDFLGVLPTKKRKRKFGFIDRLIDRFFTREKWTKEQRIAFVVAHLKMISEKHNANELVLMTNLKLTKPEKSLVDDVIARLKEQGVTITLGEQIHQNMESYEQVRSCGYTVLLEKEGASFYTDIQQELLLCRQAEIKIVGAITFVQ